MGSDQSPNGGNSHQRAVQRGKLGKEAEILVPLVAARMEAKSRPPWYQSTLLWGCLSLCAAVVLTVVAAMKHDVRWLLIFSWPFLCIAAWEFATYFTQSQGKRGSVTASVAVVSAFGLYFLSQWLRPEALGGVTTAEPIIEPIYSFNLIGLPIAIEPYANTTMILIQPDRTIQVQNVLNEKGTTLAWPTSEEIYPPENSGQINLANHGNINAFNVSYSLNVAIGAQKDTEGVVSAAVSLPLFDLPSGGRSPAFHIVNESPFAVTIGLSDSATLLLQGENNRRQIKVKPRSITFFDKIPMLFPSQHKWRGGKIFEPDQRKTLRYSENTVPKEIIEQWKKDMVMAWRKRPLGQAAEMGLDQTFDAGMCDAGVNDLEKEIPGRFQNWGLRGAAFGCASNQLASHGLLDFAAAKVSVASTYTRIPNTFAHTPVEVSISWYADARRGTVKWIVSKACVGRGESIVTAPVNSAVMTAAPNAKDPSIAIDSSADIPVLNCKRDDTIFLSIEREGDSQEDTLQSTAHVHKVELDMRAH